MKHSKHSPFSKQHLRESLDVFEQLESLSVRDEWTASVLQRAQQRSSQKVSHSRSMLTSLSLCVVIVANVWAAKQLMNHDDDVQPVYSQAQAQSYTTIAQEFLIQSH